MKTAKDVLKAIKDNDVKYVDLRFTDPRGKWQHVTFDQSMVDEDMFSDGTMFDGSSIAGWKAINESDMVMMPDAEGAHIDPFFQQTTLALFCDVLEPAPSREGLEPCVGCLLCSVSELFAAPEFQVQALEGGGESGRQGSESTASEL